jgi:hypothetical protein
MENSGILNMIKCCGFGVWSNVNSWTPTLVSGYLPATSRFCDGGQTGYLFGGLQSAATSTGWGTASSITGSTRQQPQTVTAINLKSYILVKSYLGGYSWTNVAG